MEFVRSLRGYDHLWAVKFPGQDTDELTRVFRNWSNFDFLLDFFLDNQHDLENFFHVHRIREAIQDTVEDADDLEKMILQFPGTGGLDSLFHPLSLSDNRAAELTREKARNWDRERHASWLRIYAIRLEKGIYVVTGGAIKLTPTMQERPHTKAELDKMDKCREYLKSNGVFDQDSFIDYINEGKND